MASATPIAVLAQLPTPRTNLVGRQSEVTRGRSLLLEEAVALVTLTGPGGIGKTRLALAIAHNAVHAFADGVAFVDLAALDDPALVAAAVARAVGISVETAADPDQQLADALRPRCAAGCGGARSPRPRSRRTWRRSSGSSTPPRR
jgi:hypothetical protein